MPGVDAYIVSVSGGRDSTAALAVAVSAAERLSAPVVAVYADNGCQWPEAWKYIWRVCARLGVQVQRAHTARPLLDEVSRRGRWPGWTTRYCTAMKRDAIAREVRRLFPRRADRPPWQLVLVTGERHDESPRRRRLAEWEVDARLTGQGTVRVVRRWRPLLTWSAADVEHYLGARGVSILSVYSYGMSRNGCLFCPFAPPDEWRIAAAHYPEMAAHVVAVERRIGHRLTQAVSMEEALT